MDQAVRRLAVTIVVMEPTRPWDTERLCDARMDRSVGRFGTLDDDDEHRYWRSVSPEERLAAVELLRRINYGEDAATARLQRVFEWAELGAG
jgi:hypothetical protein